MARTKIPDPLERRHLLEGKLDPTRALGIAEAYCEADRHLESIAFFERAAATDQLESLGAQALEQGDAFMFKQVYSALGREPDADDWRRLADHGESQGRLRYAATARRQIDRREQ